MKSDGEIMEILAAYDLTGSARSAVELARCSHHTVTAHVAARDAGRAVGAPARRRPRNIDEFMNKVEEWVEASKAGFAPTGPTRSCRRSGSVGRTGRPAGRSRK